LISNYRYRTQASAALSHVRAGERVYFVHSFRVMETPANAGWTLATTTYGVEFVSAVQKSNVMAMQFHPEKSGTLGLQLFESFLTGEAIPDHAAAQVAAGTHL
jgi:glutamine amidotransferase/cyclase